MAINVRAGGNWYPGKSSYVNVSGAWQTVKGAWVNVSGVWKSIMGWTQKAESYSPSLYGHLAGTSDALYYIGGYEPGNSSATTRVMKYTPASDSWTNDGTLGSYRKNDGICVCRANRYIHVFGGTDDYFYHACYDTVTKTATNKASIYSSQGPVMGVTDTGEIFAAGGFDNGARNYCRKWVDNGSTGVTTVLANLPASLAWGMGGVIGGRFYFFGGQTTAGVSVDSGYFYDIASNVWYAAPSMPEPISRAAHFIKDGKLCIVTSAGRMYVFNPSTNAWTQGPDCPIYTYSPKGAVSGNLGYVHGGADNATGAYTGRLYSIENI